MDGWASEVISAAIAATATLGAAWITTRERREAREDRVLADEVRRLLRARLDSSGSCSPPSCPGSTTTPTPAPTGGPSSSPNETS